MTAASTLRSAYAKILRIQFVGPLVRLPLHAVRRVMPVLLPKDMRQKISDIETVPRQPIIIQSSPAPAADRSEELDVLTAVVGSLRGRLAAAEAANAEGLTRLAERIEFVRQETMFELRASIARAGSTSLRPTIGPGQDGAARILAPERIELLRATGKFRINIGCGHAPMHDCVNIDMRELPGVDIVAGVGNLPFDASSIDEIYSSHVLEHFPREHLARVLLPYWVSLLRSGGLLVAVAPDAEAMLSDYGTGQMSFDDLRVLTYGLQEYEGDFHFNIFSREGFETLFRDAGLTRLEWRFQGRKNGKCRDMELTGTKA